MILYSVSVNYREHSADVRGRFAFNRETRDEIRKQLALRGITQSVVLCTCNRSEIYYPAEDDSHTDDILDMLCSGDTDIKGSISVFRGKQAVRHLFRVCCGIDSMILGEDEILRQTRSAYYESLETGFAGYEINTVFQSAITCAKRIKTETELSRSSVSAATLSANEAASFMEKVRVLVIGASGNIGSSTVKNLLAHRNVTVTRTVRSHSGYQLITPEKVQDIPYSERYDRINDFDCIISATSSPHFTITASKVEERLQKGRKMLFIDLAVPADIENSVKDIDGVTLIGIDHFKKLSEKNNAIKKQAAEQAEIMISEEIDKYNKKVIFHDFQPKMEMVRANLGKLSFEEIIFELRDLLDSDRFGALIGALETL